MTTLERAKAFAQSSTRLALTIVPLAIAAADAVQGSVLIPPSFTVSSASCPGGSVSNLAINNNSGIKLYTGTSCSAFVSGGGGLELLASGTGTGVIPVSSIPVNVVFTPTYDGGANIDYRFILSLNGSNNAPQLMGSVASGTVVSQSFNFDVGPGVTPLSWYVLLILTIPSNSSSISIFIAL